MSVIIEDLNGPKYVHCRLLCFEVKLSQVDTGFQIDDYVPVVLKYEKTLKSINDYLSQIVKTGSISLLLVPKNNADRQIYSQITDLFRNILHPENVELLSRDYSDNLLPKSTLTQGQILTQGGTPSSSLSSKENTIKKDGGKSQAKPQTGQSNLKETKGQDHKLGKNQEKQGKTHSKGVESTIEEKVQMSPTSEQPKEEVYTFHDVLNEVILGIINPTSAANSQLLNDKPDLKDELAPLASRTQQLSLRYSNGHKLKCLNCQKQNYHTCKVNSSSASRLEELYRQLRDGKVSEQPAVAIPLSVLVSDEQALTILDQRALSDDGGRGIQLKSNIDINYCLETMQKKEDMGKDSLVDCPKCGQKTEREICYIIEKAPKLFLIQLKRFKTDIDYKTGTIEKRKVCTMIDLKETIAIKDQQFELYGVVNHYGEIDKGHYTACVKRPSDDQWFLYDDEKVTKITFKEVNSEGAYLLFYQLKNINP